MPEPRLVIDFDHHSPDYAKDPVGRMRDLRTTCPVAFTEAHGGFWTVTRYADVRAVAYDTDTFSSRHDVPSDGVSFTGALIPAPPTRFRPIEMDPPEATRYRRLLNPLFSRQAVEAYRPMIEEFTRNCLDAKIETGEIDFVLDLTNPLPSMATLAFLGLPVQEWEAYAMPYHNMVCYPPGSDAYNEACEGIERCIGNLIAALADRKANPRDDLLSMLITAEIDGEPIEYELVVETISALLAAGLDTTTGALTNALSYLGEHPELRAPLIEDPARIPVFIEEALRWFSPTQGLARTATKDVELRGQLIKAGERVLVCWAGANRDGEEFDRPDEFIPDRTPNRHASFGMGLHTCLGAPFARLQMSVAVEQVLARMPDYRVSPDIQRYESIGLVNGWISMPATFTPGRRSS